MDSPTLATFRPKIAEGDVTKVAMTQTFSDGFCLFLHTRCKIDAREGSQSFVAISYTVKELYSMSTRGRVTHLIRWQVNGGWQNTAHVQPSARFALHCGETCLLSTDQLSVILIFLENCRRHVPDPSCSTWRPFGDCRQIVGNKKALQIQIFKFDAKAAG